jgi:hypothetical protein
MEDIILVTGCHHSKTWANVVFVENQTDAQASFGIRMCRSNEDHGISVKWEFPLGKARGAVRRWGPDGNLNVRYFEIYMDFCNSEIVLA